MDANLPDVAPRPSARIEALSRDLLQEMYFILNSAESDKDERDRDCRRLQEILGYGAPGVQADASFEFGQTMLVLALHYDFGHQPQMLRVVLDAAKHSDQLLRKTIVNTPTNEVDGEHILEVVASLRALGGDEHMDEKEALLVAAGADLNWMETSTGTQRSSQSN